MAIKGIFKNLQNINVKIGIAVALIVGYQTLLPTIKDFLGINDDIEAVIEKCYKYADQKDSVFIHDIRAINQRYKRDSIDESYSSQKFAVGFRADAQGIMSYRSRKKIDCSVQINHITGQIEFYDEHREKWSVPFIEDR